MVTVKKISIRRIKILVANLLFLLIAGYGMAQQKYFDTHVHLWNGKESYQNYLSQLDSTNQKVARFCGILIARQGEPLVTKAKNDELLELARQHPVLVPVCSVHPLDGDSAIQEIKRLGGLGVKVIKLHPHTQNFDVTDQRVLKLCRIAGELNMMILMDNASIKAGDCENLFDLAVKCPGTRFIFAHTGAFNFRFWNIIPVARTAKGFFNDNIYFDISATVVMLAGSPLEAEFIWTLRNIGIDHVFLGSDYPQYSLKQAADALGKMHLEPAEKNRISYDNANSMFTTGVK